MGVNGAFTVVATGSPTPTLSKSGALPSGVTFTASTGVLSGTPAAGTSGTYPITVTAANGALPNATQSFTLTVNQAPAITSASNTTFVVGTSRTFTVTATGSPAATFSETGTLPAGVTLTAAGSLAGTPAPGSGGTYPIAITASNGVLPNATQNFTLTVNQSPAITSANTTTFTVGTSGTFTVMATGTPAPTFSETGPLPTGVTLTAAGLLAGTPAAGTNGTYPITITAANGVGTNATQSFTLTVNQVAAIISANSSTFAVGAAGSFTVTATGSPKPVLSESGALPSGVTFAAATGVLSGTPGAGTGGTYPITFSAQNGVGTTATQSFTLTVNQSPAIVSANIAGFSTGTAATFTVTATGTPKPTLSESGALPSGMTFAAATGVLSGAPAAGTVGIYPLIFTAQNSVGANATQSFTLTISQNGCTPVLPPGGTYVTDPTFATFGVTSNLTRALNAALSPACATTAATYMETTATGQHAATETYTGSITNGAAITETMYLANVSGSRYFDMVLFDQSWSHYGGVYGINPTTCSTSQSVFVDSGTNHWTLPATPLKLTQVTVGGVAWCQIQLTLIPQSSATGLNLFTNYDTSGTGGGGSYTGDGTSGMKFWGEAIQPAAAPAITSSAGATFTIGIAGTFGVMAAGTPAPTLTESGALPSGVTFTAATGMLSGTPTAGTAGAYPVTFTAQNGVGSNAAQNFTLTVASGSTPPAITTPSSATFAVSIAGTFTVTATGTPTPALSESGSLPSGVTFTAATGSLSGTPAVGTNGTYPITFTAANGVGANATQSFTLTVNQSQAAAMTSANNTIFAVGTPGTFQVTATGSPAPTFSETGALPAGVSFTAGGILGGTPAAGTAGSYPITITAQNGILPPATQSFTLTVNQAPAITSANNATFALGVASTFTVTATGTPAPTLSETGSLPSGVTFAAATGILSGTPATGSGGTYPIGFSAQNGVGGGATQSFTLTVNTPPSITTQPSNQTVPPGQTGKFSVVATGNAPLSYQWSMNGIPVSGATSSSYTTPATTSLNNGEVFTVAVSNAQGSATSNLASLTVSGPGALVASLATVNFGNVQVGGSSSVSVQVTNFGGTGITLSSSTASGPGFTTSNPAGQVLAPRQSTTLTVKFAPTATGAATGSIVLSASGVNSTTIALIGSGTASGIPAVTIAWSESSPNAIAYNVYRGSISGGPYTLLNSVPLSGSQFLDTAVTLGQTYFYVLSALDAMNNASVYSSEASMQVTAAPVITSANSLTLASGAAGTFTVTATGFPVAALAETATLPNGMTFTDNLNNTGTLAWTTAIPLGSYGLTFTADNGVLPIATQNFTMVVNGAPAITSANSTSFAAGTAGTFTVTATGTPAATFSETGTLPAGVTLTAAGSLAGTPAPGSGGTYPIAITASNGVLPNATQNFTLTVNQSPAITSANTTTFTVGTSGTFTVMATGTPAPTFSETGPLPTGVTLTAAGLLAGTPAAGTGALIPLP